jgi:hypothetical protein
MASPAVYNGFVWTNRENSTEKFDEWQVERSYRVYHKEACATSLIHPQAVQAQNIK